MYVEIERYQEGEEESTPEDGQGEEAGQAGKEERLIRQGHGLRPDGPSLWARLSPSGPDRTWPVGQGRERARRPTRELPP